MATFTLIKQLRLDLADPPHVVDLIQVATPADFPSDPVFQTAYTSVSAGGYYRCDLDSGAGIEDYHPIPLQISDARLSSWLDSLSYLKAKIQAIKAIINRLSTQLPLVKDQSSAETSDYQRLLDVYNFYKGMLSDALEEDAEASNNATGKYGSTHTPVIGGGNL